MVHLYTNWHVAQRWFLAVPRLVVHATAAGQTFKVQLLYDTWTPQDWNNPWMISSLTDLRIFIFISSPAVEIIEKHAKSITAFISCAKDGFEKVCLSVWHTRVLSLFVSLLLSLSVSETEKDISQLKTKERLWHSFRLLFIFLCF